VDSKANLAVLKASTSHPTRRGRGQEASQEGREPPRHADLIYVNLETLAEFGVLCVERIIKEYLELCRGNRIQIENLLKTRGQTSKEPHSSWLIFMHYYGPLPRVCDWSETLPTGSEVPTTSPASATPDIQELARLTPFENKHTF
jgi:hypothetical protein